MAATGEEEDQQQQPTTKVVSEDILNVIQSGQVKKNSSNSASNKLSLLMDSSSSEDEEQSITAAVKQKKNVSKRGIIDMNSGILSDGYDVDFYGDAEDKARLFSMTEVEREAILYERAQARQARQERRALEQRIREREEGTSLSSVGKRAPTKEVDLKRKRLDELKAKRQIRSLGEDGDHEEEEEEEGEFDGDEEEDSEEFEEEEETSRRQKKKQQRKAAHRKRSEDSDEDYYTDEPASNNKTKSRRGTAAAAEVEEREDFEDASDQEFDLDLANKLRLSRDIISQWIYRDGFEDISHKCLLRISLGSGMYRIVELRKLVKYHRTYLIKPGTPTNLAVNVRHAKAERVFTFEIVSNSPFTEAEFLHWKRECDREGVKLPYNSVTARRKIQKLKAFNSEALTDSMIASMIERRKDLLDAQAAPRNLLAEQTILQQQLKEALERNNTDEVTRIEAELSAISQKRQQISESSVDRLAVMEDLNRRNRQTNLETGRQAEIARMQTELQVGSLSAASNNSNSKSSNNNNTKTSSSTLDPFQRRKCKPSINHMHSTEADSEISVVEKQQQIKEEETPLEPEMVILESTKKPTNLFDAHNFDLDLEI